jgi:uracil-DNA glycosylase family 4
VAKAKRPAFADWTYWGRPVPGFGDHRAKILIVGLAPAAHGANRTGRMFTGDRSGEFLYAGLHRAGLANQGESTHRGDGLALRDVYISAAVRCAPPANKPTPGQLHNCRSYLAQELAVLEPRVVLCLGAIAWDAVVRTASKPGHDILRPRPRFGHGKQVEMSLFTLLGCFHVSQQNTFTGRLTPAMLDAVLERAKALAKGPGDRLVGRTRGRASQ